MFLSIFSSITLVGVDTTVILNILTKGGKYRVISNSGKDEPMETMGEFVGYTLLGEEGAVCFRIEAEL